MRATLHLAKYYAFVVVAFVSFGVTSNNAFAVVIDFDDLAPIYDPLAPCFCDNPLTDQYASQGLIISNAYLNGESSDGGLTYENILLSGPYTQLSFIGVLPTFVSMYVSSANQDAIYLTAFGPMGYIAQQQTPGFAGSENDPIAAPNQLISFSSATGISAINIESFYFLRTGAAIDNLTYTYSSVPEPSSLILLILGFMTITWRRLSK